MNAIETHGLTKNYTGFTLDALDLTVPTGCIVGLIGENGAGKTTTIKTLLGMVKPDGGSAEVMGCSIGEDMTDVRNDIGVVLDEPGLPLCFTVADTGKVMSGIFRTWDPALYDKLINKLNVPRDKTYQEMSRGTRMKLGIAVAIAHRPRLLIMDEPTSGLDPVVRDEVVDLFGRFTRNPEHSILISSHIVSDLEKLCDYIAFIHRGKLMLFEEKDKLLEEYALLRCSAEEAEKLDADAVIGRKDTPYGVSVIVRRDRLAEGTQFSPVTLEELFVFMVKEEA